MKPRSLALAATLAALLSGTVLAQVEVGYKVETTTLTVGGQTMIAVGLFQNGQLVPHDSARFQLTNPLGLASFSPQSWGSNQVSYFRMNALRAGRCKVVMTYNSPCGARWSNSFGFQVEERRTATMPIHRIAIYQTLPCGSVVDVTGQSVDLHPGEPSLFEAVGFCRYGRRIPLDADIRLDGYGRGFHLRELGGNRFEITARGWRNSSMTLTVSDRAGSGRWAQVVVLK